MALGMRPRLTAAATAITTQRRRVTTLDRAVIEQFSEYLTKGLPFDGCLDILCVSSAAFYDWLRRGKMLADGSEPEDAYATLPETELLCMEFYLAI